MAPVMRDYTHIGLGHQRDDVRTRGWERHPQDPLLPVCRSVSIRGVHGEAEDGHARTQDLVQGRFHRHHERGVERSLLPWRGTGSCLVGTDVSHVEGLVEVQVAGDGS